MTPQDKLKEIKNNFVPILGLGNSIKFKIELEDIQWLIKRVDQLESVLDSLSDHGVRDDYAEVPIKDFIKAIEALKEML